MDQKVFWVALSIAAGGCLCSWATTIDFIYRGGTYAQAYHFASRSYETNFDSGNNAENILGRSDSTGYMPAGAVTNELEKNFDRIFAPNTVDLHAAISFDSAAEPSQDYPQTEPAIALSGLLISNGELSEFGALTIGANLGVDPSLILMAVGSIGILVSSRMD